MDGWLHVFLKKKKKKLSSDDDDDVDTSAHGFTTYKFPEFIIMLPGNIRFHFFLSFQLLFVALNGLF